MHRETTWPLPPSHLTLAQLKEDPKMSPPSKGGPELSRDEDGQITGAHDTSPAEFANKRKGSRKCAKLWRRTMATAA